MSLFLILVMLQDASVFIDSIKMIFLAPDDCTKHMTQFLQLTESANMTLKLAECLLVCQAFHYRGRLVGAVSLSEFVKTTRYLQKVEHLITFSKWNSSSQFRSLYGRLVFRFWPSLTCDTV